jgi:hypothetical protein
MPARPAFTVRLKFQEDGPKNPSFVKAKMTILPPLAPRRVLIMTRATVAPSSGLVIVPRDPPLKERNPTVRRITPIPVSCREYQA